MEIFNWVKEIEDLYKELIEKTQNENLTEIQNLKNKNDELIDKTLMEKQKFVSLWLKNLSDTVNDEIKKLNLKLVDVFKEIELNFQKRCKNLEESIIEKLGFNF